MNLELAPVSDFKDFKYNRDNGPHTPLKTAVNDGINCQWVVHELTRAIFGKDLPEDYMSKEIWEDPLGIFDTINPDMDQPRMGDVIVASRIKKPDPKKLHLAVFVDGESVLHATSFEENVSEWPLSKFREMYPVLWAVKRLRI